MRREIVPRLAGLDRLLQSAVQVPTWQCASDRRAAVSSLALSPLASSEPLVQSHLPMWSSLRRPWPSSSCVRRLGCFGDGATRWSTPLHKEAGGRVSTNVTV